MRPFFGFFRGGDNEGNPGDGGGEKTRWLKLKREDVEDRGPLSYLLYEVALRRLIRGGETIIFAWVAPDRSRVGGMVSAVCVRPRDVSVKEWLERELLKAGQGSQPAQAF